MGDRMKKTIQRFLILTLLFAVLGYAIGLLLGFLLNSFEFSTALLSDKVSLICLGAGALGGIVYALAKPVKKDSGSAKKGRLPEGRNMSFTLMQAL